MVMRIKVRALRDPRLFSYKKIPPALAGVYVLSEASKKTLLNTIYFQIEIKFSLIKNKLTYFIKQRLITK